MYLKQKVFCSNFSEPQNSTTDRSYLDTIIPLSLQYIQKIMGGAILHTDSEKDLSLILQLTKKLGISARKLTKAGIEDYGLSIAISEGKTGEYVDTESFLRELRDGDQDY